MTKTTDKKSVAKHTRCAIKRVFLENAWVRLKKPSQQQIENRNEWKKGKIKYNFFLACAHVVCFVFDLMTAGIYCGRYNQTDGFKTS